MMGKWMFVFYLSLALGYILCVIAKKQESLLRTVGYTLGIAIIVMTFLAALAGSYSSCMMMGKGKPGFMGKAGKGCCPMMKHCMPMKGMQ